MELRCGLTLAGGSTMGDGAIDSARNHQMQSRGLC
jgi:hypothetical protein